MNDFFQEIDAIAKQQWHQQTDIEGVQAELVRRFGKEWQCAVMGFCSLQSGQEIYTALIADSPETTDFVNLQFIIVEWDGSTMWIHQTITTDGSGYQGY